jgi:L-amino acid N-acyltransferase YncA
MQSSKGPRIDKRSGATSRAKSNRSIEEAWADARLSCRSGARSPRESVCSHAGAAIQTMVSIKLAQEVSELEGILALQRRNLKRCLSESEAEEQGFLVAEYNLAYLQQMQARRPSVVAVDDGRVVGYALVVTQEVRKGLPFISDLFDEIDRISYRGALLAGTDYVVVGQLCVDKDYRGQGLVDRLYGCFRASLDDRYHCGVTDIARANRRSLKAHQKVGFEVIHTIEYEGRTWDVVLWDWSELGR